MGVYIEGLDMLKEHSLWMVIHPNGQVWMRKRHYCQNLEGVEATELDLVRCGECKYMRKYALRSDEPTGIWCHRWSVPRLVTDDDFCSYGKRRTDETIESITFKKMVKAVEEEMREVRNFVKRINDEAVCSYGVSANANQHAQRIEGIGERRTNE